jgi:hypothetical protein
MKPDCLDIGTIQAFMDGELSHDDSSHVSGHLAACDACARALAEAEDEAAIVFPALAREMDSLVPTQRLWTKIDDAIRDERKGLRFWRKAWTYVATALASPAIAVAASVLLVMGISVLYLVNRKEATADIADNTIASRQMSTTATVQLPTIDRIPIQTTTQGDRPVFHPQRERFAVTPAVVRTIQQRSVNSVGYLPGEESFVQTISNLTKTVESQKDGVLRPSERVAYERDMAVVDDSIAKIRNEVRRNPKNETARQVLYSSYQNKIDLLNSVSQKEELVASLK